MYHHTYPILRSHTLAFSPKIQRNYFWELHIHQFTHELNSPNGAFSDSTIVLLWNCKGISHQVTPLALQAIEKRVKARPIVEKFLVKAKRVMLLLTSTDDANWGFIVQRRCIRSWPRLTTGKNWLVGIKFGGPGIPHMGNLRSGRTGWTNWRIGPMLSSLQSERSKEKFEIYRVGYLWKVLDA